MVKLAAFGDSGNSQVAGEEQPQRNTYRILILAGAHLVMVVSWVGGWESPLAVLKVWGSESWGEMFQCVAGRGCEMWDPGGRISESLRPLVGVVLFGCLN